MTTTTPHRIARARTAISTVIAISAALVLSPIAGHVARADQRSDAGRSDAGRPEGPPANFVPKPGHQRFLVVYRNAADMPAQATALRGAGADVLASFTKLMPTMAVSMTPDKARSLKSDPRVASVEADSIVSANATESPAPWGLDRIDQRALPLSNSYSYDSAGAGVTTYVIDTGLNLTHTDLAGRVGQGWDFVDNDADPSDCAGHGTHVAATIAGTQYGVAKAATVVPVRVLDCSGAGYMSTVIAGLDWVAANAKKPAVANLSLGGAASSALDSAIERLVAAGVTVVVAAGNSNVDACSGSPARTPGAIAVGATGSNDARASYSNYGSCVALFAPGSSITSAWIGSTTAYATISGTSMASPHVAGAAAAYLATNPTASPATVRNALVSAATANAVTGAGAGSPNLLLFSGSSAPAPTTTTTSTTLAPTTTTTAVTTTTKAPTTTTTLASTTTTLAPSATTSTTKATTTTTSTTTTKATTTTTIAPSATTTTVKASVPAAPTNVAASAIRYGARITWTIGANGGSAITSQQIRVYQVTSTGALSFIGYANVGATVNAVQLTGLTPGRSYRIAITATNAIGPSPESAKSNIVVPTA